MVHSYWTAQAQRKDKYENSIGIQKVLSIGWIVVLEADFIWHEECSQSILEIVVGDHG